MDDDPNDFSCQEPTENHYIRDLSVPRYEICSRKEATAYAAAGRPDLLHRFADLRSASKPQTRSRTQSEKYYGWRGVNRTQAGHLHYRPPEDVSNFGFACLLKDAVVAPLTPREMYEEAQMYPRPPTYKRSGKKIRRNGLTLKVERRWELRKHAFREMVRDEEEAFDDDFMYDEAIVEPVLYEQVEVNSDADRLFHHSRVNDGAVPQTEDSDTDGEFVLVQHDNHESITEDEWELI